MFIWFDIQNIQGYIYQRMLFLSPTWHEFPGFIYIFYFCLSHVISQTFHSPLYPCVCNFSLFYFVLLSFPSHPLKSFPQSHGSLPHFLAFTSIYFHLDAHIQQLEARICIWEKTYVEVLVLSESIPDVPILSYNQVPASSFITNGSTENFSTMLVLLRTLTSCTEALWDSLLI